MSETIRLGLTDTETPTAEIRNTDNGKKDISRRDFISRGLKAATGFALAAGAGLSESGRAEAQEKKVHQFSNFAILVETNHIDNKKMLPIAKKLPNKTAEINTRIYTKPVDIPADTLVLSASFSGSPRPNELWEETPGNSVEKGARRDGEQILRSEVLRRVPGADKLPNTTDAILNATVRKQSEQRKIPVTVKIDVNIKWNNKLQASPLPSEHEQNTIYFKAERTTDGQGRARYKIIEIGTQEPLEKKEVSLPEVKNNEQFLEAVNAIAIEEVIKRQPSNAIAKRIKESTL